jgi:hypothetical protein
VTNFDLVKRLWKKSRCVAIGSLGFDLVDHIGVIWKKPIRCYRLLGTLTYFDYRQNKSADN